MNKINILSSDLRYDALCKIFNDNGIEAHLCTVDTMDKCDALILPIKSTLTDEEFSKIFQGVERSALVFSGEENKVRAHFEGEIINYSLDEGFIDRNAYITAECALSLLLNDLDKTILESKCAIVGYGRIGKHLTSILQKLGAEVTVFARRKESRDLAIQNGALAYDIEKISDESYDAIFNTVPKQIVTKEQSDKIPKSTLVYDLASLPGGFQDEIFPKRALALPGKMMPVSAGGAIFDFVKQYISYERK